MDMPAQGMPQMDPAIMQKLVQLLSQNEQADQMANATASADRLRGHHHSFLGGLLGGAGSALGEGLQMKQRGSREAQMQDLLALLGGSPGSYDPFKEGGMGSPLGGADQT